ncbi:HesA/MoeB/ThiF family protein [Pasteurella skyensis]|uniref:HesA/MoeB/ThiF family protein n=1 Tax=Phocoenobacter skyensis TaxID=97481 RepID=A0AAJ6NF52_9PAST|nr:HesA/MoeB/ThiF family protein [Pasteurella skyensis]MDP8171483.1 HesA/MoeB/ThiF family protein [Pasteurella skyensis]MDP8175687.1 HesA/MoeB/ThiF family protein [Pasteurella skyensis]
MQHSILDVSRQLLVKGMTAEKQQQLNNSRVLVIGAGGLATTAVSYLAMSGIGHITIVDYDDIEPSNLHRQTLFTQNDLGNNKAETVKQYLLARNPQLDVKAIGSSLDVQTLLRLISQYDVVLDCTDMLSFSYMLNDVAILRQIPVIFANASAMTGQLFTMIPQQDQPFSCFRCMWPEGVEVTGSCDILGVLGPVPGTMGCLQALETIKLLSGFYPVAESVLYHFDFYSLSLNKITIPFDHDCCHSQSDKAIVERYTANLVFQGELGQALEQGYEIIDIRRENEVNTKPCEYATAHFTPDQLLDNPSDFLSKSKSYIFICSNGTRSKSLVKYLQYSGFSQTFTYQEDW